MAWRRNPWTESDRTRMTIFSRRDFLQVAAASSAGAALYAAQCHLGARSQRAAGVPLPSATLSLITGGGGNVVVMGSADGALLVDGGSKARSAAAIKLALKSVSAKKLHTLFNTHWHPDQTGSNDRVAKHGGRIIAQENTKLWLGRKIVTEWLPEGYGPLPKPALPNKSFYTTDSHRLRRRHAQVRSPGPGAHRWRPVRSLHEGQRAGCRWRGFKRRLAGAGLADRWMDRWTGRRLRPPAESGRRQDGRHPGQRRACRAARNCRPGARCTSRSSTAA